MLLFLEVNINEIRVSESLFACCCFISQYHENDIISIAIDLCMLFQPKDNFREKNDF